MLENTDWKGYVGKRCLVITNRWSERISEVIILEVSRKGKNIKLEYVKTGETEWISFAELSLKECLD